MCLESNGVDRVRSLRKILPRLHGTDFCTSLVHFAQSVVTQPNYPKCSEIVQNFRHDFMAQTFAPFRLILHRVL